MSAMNSQTIVEEFINAFNALDIDRACDMLAEDVDYRNMPMPPIKGREAARSFLKMEGIKEIEWELLNIAASGDVVMTERVDRFAFEDGKALALPLMGVFKVADGQIVEWRDYFDMADFQRQMA